MVVADVPHKTLNQHQSEMSQLHSSFDKIFVFSVTEPLSREVWLRNSGSHRTLGDILLLRLRSDELFDILS